MARATLPSANAISHCKSMAMILLADAAALQRGMEKVGWLRAELEPRGGNRFQVRRAEPECGYLTVMVFIKVLLPQATMAGTGDGRILLTS